MHVKMRETRENVLMKKQDFHTVQVGLTQLVSSLILNHYNIIEINK